MKSIFDFFKKKHHTFFGHCFFFETWFNESWTNGKSWSYQPEIYATPFSLLSSIKTGAFFGWRWGTPMTSIEKNYKWHWQNSSSGIECQSLAIKTWGYIAVGLSTNSGKGHRIATGGCCLCWIRHVRARLQVQHGVLGSKPQFCLKLLQPSILSYIFKAYLFFPNTQNRYNSKYIARIFATLYLRVLRPLPGQDPKAEFKAWNALNSPSLLL